MNVVVGLLRERAWWMPAHLDRKRNEHLDDLLSRLEHDAEHAHTTFDAVILFGRSRDTILDVLRFGSSSKNRFVGFRRINKLTGEHITILRRAKRLPSEPRKVEHDGHNFGLNQLMQSHGSWTSLYAIVPDFKPTGVAPGNYVLADGLGTYLISRLVVITHDGKKILRPSIEPHDTNVTYAFKDAPNRLVAGQLLHVHISE